MRISPFHEGHLDGVVALALKAWAPVFASVKETMDDDTYAEYYPDWRKTQEDAARSVCTNDRYRVWVALMTDDASEGEAEGTLEALVVGFVASKIDRDESTGEIYMIAADPDYQRKGIASALTEQSLAWFKDEGITMAVVDTGLDPGHAPARKTYESLGFHLWPTARYYRSI